MVELPAPFGPAMMMTLGLASSIAIIESYSLPKSKKGENASRPFNIYEAERLRLFNRLGDLRIQAFPFLHVVTAFVPQPLDDLVVLVHPALRLIKFARLQDVGVG